jgi:hypothetical protein
MGRYRHISLSSTGWLTSMDVVVMVIILVLEEGRGDGMAAMKKEEHASCEEIKYHINNVYKHNESEK